MVCNYAPAYRLLSYRVWKGLQFLQQGFHLRFWISYCAVALLAVGPACLPACLQGFCLSPGWAMCWPPVYTFEVCSCTPTETQGKAMAEKQELWQDGRLPLKCGGHVISLKGRKSMEGIFRLEKMPSPVLSLGGNFQNTSRFGQHALLIQHARSIHLDFYSAKLFAMLAKFLANSWCHEFFLFRHKILGGSCNAQLSSQYTEL